ncbi:MAG: OmpA family protein [Magnetococcales bacterium]|nr:OmpA family protein [Magnetococcales bacterium]
MDEISDDCYTNKSWASSWLMPFSSVLALMLAICILLLSVSQFDPSRLAAASASIRATFGMGVQPERFSAARQSQETMEFQQAIELVRIKDMRDAKSLEAVAVDEGFLMRLSFEGLFAPGKLTFRQDIKPLLKQIAALIAKTSNVIRIEGHTSEQSPEAALPVPGNWAYSAAAAAMVADFLATEGGVDPSRLVVRGMGHHLPRDSNQTAEGRTNNRRVEIILTREMRPVATTVASQPNH